MIDRHPHVTVTTEESAGQLTQRIRNLISTVALDCDCRQRVNDALQRFANQETKSGAAMIGAACWTRASSGPPSQHWWNCWGSLRM